MRLKNPIDKKVFESVDIVDYLKPLDLRAGMVVTMRISVPAVGGFRYIECHGVITEGRPLHLYEVQRTHDKVISTLRKTEGRSLAIQLSHPRGAKRKYNLPLLLHPLSGEIVNLNDRYCGYLVEFTGDSEEEVKTKLSGMEFLELGPGREHYGEPTITEQLPKKLVAA